MSRLILYALLAWIIAVGATWDVAANQPLEDEDEQGVELKAVLKAIQEAVKEAQANDLPGFPPLQSATMTFQTIATFERGLSFKFLIFSIETKAKTEKASTISLRLTSPPKIELKTIGAVDPDKLRHALAKAITIAKLGTSLANQGDPKLDMNLVKIQIRFAVAKGGSAGADTAELLPIGVKGSLKADSNQIHSVDLEYGWPKKEENPKGS